MSYNLYHVAITEIFNMFFSKKEKKIVPLMDNEQNFIEEHNAKLTPKQQIPIVPRNQTTGWPLLQVGMLTHVVGSDNYGTVVGGEKCHSFNFPHYFLALLLTKLHVGKLKESDIAQDLGSQMGKYGNRYSVMRETPNLEVTVKSVMGYPSYQCHIVGQDLSALFMKTKSIYFKQEINFFSYNDPNRYGEIEESYSEKQILDAIDPNFAIFHNGQVFVDLGKFLEGEKVDKEVIELFESLFQVKAFKEQVAEENKRLALLTDEEEGRRYLASFRHLMAHTGPDKSEIIEKAVEHRSEILAYILTVKDPAEKTKLLEEAIEPATDLGRVFWAKTGFFSPNLNREPLLSIGTELKKLTSSLSHENR